MKRMFSMSVGTIAAVVSMGCSAENGMEGSEATGFVESPAIVAYRIDAVPSLVSGGTSAASAINDEGVVGGSSQTSSSVVHAIRWARGSAPEDLGALGRGNASASAGINRALTVVGVANVTSVASHAFVYANRGPIKELPHLDFGGLSPATQTFGASGVNDAGLIVGTSPLQLGAPTFAAYTRAVVWKAGAITDLGSLGDTNSTGSAVNASGWVTGSTSTPAAAEHAFLWNEAGMKDIGVCPGATTSQGRAINAAGDIAGWCFFPQVNGYPDGHPAVRHAFLWTASAGMRDLGSVGTRRGDVLGIGADDTVIGFTVSSTGAHVAFVAPAGGAMQALDTLLPPDSGWVLTEARAINAAGQIAGVGTLNGVARGFVLSPGNSRP
jgi:probable HAF family extracellular repeat protein